VRKESSLQSVKKRKLEVDGIGWMQSEDRRQETVDSIQMTMYAKHRTAARREKSKES